MGFLPIYCLAAQSAGYSIFYLSHKTTASPCIVVYSAVSMYPISYKGMYKKERKMEKMEIKLCCNGKGCPEVKISEKEAIITDDMGGEVTITIDELVMLRDELNGMDLTTGNHQL